MSDDQQYSLQERLEAEAEDLRGLRYKCLPPLLDEARQALDARDAEIVRLREALKDLMDAYEREADPYSVGGFSRDLSEDEKMRAARAALAQQPAIAAYREALEASEPAYVSETLASLRALYEHVQGGHPLVNHALDARRLSRAIATIEAYQSLLSAAPHRHLTTGARYKDRKYHEQQAALALDHSRMYRPTEKGYSDALDLHEYHTTQARLANQPAKTE